MKKQGQQGSPRGNIEKETGYIVILMAVYITWERLLADSNNRCQYGVLHHIAIYNVIHDSVPGQVKLSSCSISLDLSESEPEMQQVCRRQPAEKGVHCIAQEQSSMFYFCPHETQIR